MEHTQATDSDSVYGPDSPSLRRYCRLVFILIAWIGSALPTAATGQEVAEPPKPVMTPGTEIRIDDPQTGGLGYWTLYLPPDYTPERTWPIIFNFHGLDQKPNLWPFAELTDRRDFIIVGMEYLQRGLEGIDRAQEAENLKRVVDLVSKWVASDEQLRFIGGFSKGGWHSSNVAERTADLWAGVVILGAGRSSSPSATGLSGKPVFIGVGESDMEHTSAVAAADFYEQLGASVTFVTFEGRGHTVDPEDPVLKQWLQNHNTAAAHESAISLALPAQRALSVGRYERLDVASTLLSIAK